MISSFGIRQEFFNKFGEKANPLYWLNADKRYLKKFDKLNILNTLVTELCY